MPRPKLKSRIDGSEFPPIEPEPVEKPDFSIEKMISQIKDRPARIAAETMLQHLEELPPDEPSLQSLQLEAQIWRTISRHGPGTTEDTNRCAKALAILKDLSKLRSSFLSQEKFETLKEEVDRIIKENALLIETLEKQLGPAATERIVKSIEQQMKKVR